MVTNRGACEQPYLLLGAVVVVVVVVELVEPLVDVASVYLNSGIAFS